MQKGNSSMFHVHVVNIKTLFFYQFVNKDTLRFDLDTVRREKKKKTNSEE